MFGTRWSWVAVLGFALAACSHSRPATTAAPADRSADAAQEGAAEQGGIDAKCPGPMRLQGTKVAAEDTPSGESVTFTTAGDVDELRRRVHAMADMHNAHHGTDAMASGGPGGSGTGTEEQAGGMMGGMHGGMGGMHGGAGGMHGEVGLPESTASVEDVDGGARVYITPKDAADIEDVRTAVRAHVERMQTAGCGMRSGAGQERDERMTGTDREVSERI